MSKYIESFKYVIKTSKIDYSVSGVGAIAKELTIFAPGNRVMQHTAVLESIFQSSQLNLQSFFMDAAEKAEKAGRKKEKEKEPTPEEELEGNKTLALMTLKSSDKYYNALLALKEILVFEWGGKANCVIDGGQAMTREMFDDMSTLDTREIIAEYVANFIITSL